MIEPMVRATLLEDLGRAGDLTTDSIVPADATTKTILAARQPGVVAGIDFARIAFQLIDPRIEVRVEKPDGSRLRRGDTIATVSPFLRPRARRPFTKRLTRSSSEAHVTDRCSSIRASSVGFEPAKSLVNVAIFITPTAAEPSRR